MWQHLSCNHMSQMQHTEVRKSNSNENCDNSACSGISCCWDTYTQLGDFWGQTGVVFAIGCSWSCELRYANRHRPVPCDEHAEQDKPCHIRCNEGTQCIARLMNPTQQQQLFMYLIDRNTCKNRDKTQTPAALSNFAVIPQTH